MPSGSTIIASPFNNNRMRTIKTLTAKTITECLMSLKIKTFFIAIIFYSQKADHGDISYKDEDGQANGSQKLYIRNCGNVKIISVFKDQSRN